MQLHHLARNATALRRVHGGGLAFSLPSSKHGYIAQKGNRTSFAEAPAVCAFRVRPNTDVLFRIAPSASRFSHPSHLYIHFYGDRGLLDKVSVRLAGDWRSRQVTPPKGATLATLSVRLTGAGVLAPLIVSFADIRREAASPSAVDGSRGGGVLDRIATLANLSAGLLVGVCAFDDPRLTARRLLLRPDQNPPLTAERPIAAYVYDDTAPRFWGWEGCFEENHYANQALIQHLALMRDAKVPSFLVCDDRSRRKPFYPELSALFSHVIERSERLERDLIAQFGEAAA